jgi:hypothetical protein
MEDRDTPLQSDGPPVGSHDTLVQRPKQVARAVALLWISLALAPLVLVLDKSATQVPISYLIPVGLAFFGLYAALIVFIASGHNWARIVLLVMYLGGCWPYFSKFADMFRRSVMGGLVSIVQLMLQAAAMYLVFAQPSSKWFRRRHRDRDDGGAAASIP